MDSIFRKCHSWFTVVRIAHEEPRRFGRKGELLINYEETQEYAVRQASVAGGVGAVVRGGVAGVDGGDLEKEGAGRAERIENVN